MGAKRTAHGNGSRPGREPKAISHPGARVSGTFRTVHLRQPRTAAKPSRLPAHNRDEIPRAHPGEEREDGTQPPGARGPTPPAAPPTRATRPAAASKPADGCLRKAPSPHIQYPACPEETDHHGGSLTMLLHGLAYVNDVAPEKRRIGDEAGPNSSADRRRITPVRTSAHTLPAARFKAARSAGCSLMTGVLPVAYYLRRRKDRCRRSATYL